MDLAGWALYALTAAAALAMVGYLYGRREMPGRGRRLLAALRWAALAVLLLLIFDPKLPIPGAITRTDRVHILLDGSLSMGTPVKAGDPATHWELAVDEARRAAGAGEVMIFGDRPEAVPSDSLAGRVPGAAHSRLAPALRAAAEAGARRVVVLTDGGIDDIAEVNRMLPLLGLELEVRSTEGGAIVNRSVAEVEAPAWAEAGKPFEVRVGVSATGATTDSVRVIIREGDQVLAEETIEAPPAGRVAVAALDFTPTAPPGGGMVRYDITLDPADLIPDDDSRSIYLFVDEKPTGVAFISFRPDWEPRFLQPVLEQALGLPIRGFLQAQPDQFIQVGAGGEAGRPVGEAEVRRAVERASIVVLHGLDPDAPSWAHEVVREERRLLVFPEGGTEIAGLAASAPRPAGGEWFASGTIPASPITEHLGSIRTEELPPLSGLRPVTLPAGAWAPLVASQGRSSGAALPVVAGVERDGRRMVVALADGFWRWAIRDGAPRQAYRRLWSALGGWLLEDERMRDSGPVTPLTRVASRGAELLWVTTGAASDSLLLRVRDEAGAVALDTMISVAAVDTFRTPALPPGHYHYEARLSDSAAPEQEPVGGAITVESYSAEFSREAVAIADIAAVATAGAPFQRRSPGKPLHTEPWPYLVFVVLISLEWIFRRRWGLR